MSVANLLKARCYAGYQRTAVCCEAAARSSSHVRPINGPLRLSRFAAGGLILTIVLLVFCASGCGHSAEKKSVTEGSVVAVEGYTVVSQSRDSHERVPGSVRAKVEASLEAKLSARVGKLLVDVGSVIREGQPLIELDAREVQARLEQALASEAQATQDLKRVQQLLAAKAVARQEFDAVEARARVATASVAEARALVSYAKLFAPFDGVVTKRLVQSGDLAVPGKTLLLVERQDFFRFEADLPESLLGSIRPGQQLSITLAGLDSALTGVVSEVSPTLDPNSRTARVKFDLPQSDLIRTGQFGYVLVPMRTKPQLRIPATAILERGQLEVVYVIAKGTAEMRLIRTGQRSAEGVEVLSGLHAGEVVVREPSISLIDGQKVEVHS